MGGSPGLPGFGQAAILQAALDERHQIFKVLPWIPGLVLIPVQQVGNGYRAVFVLGQLLTGVPTVVHQEQFEPVPQFLGDGDGDPRHGHEGCRIQLWANCGLGLWPLCLGRRLGCPVLGELRVEPVLDKGQQVRFGGALGFHLAPR